MSDDTMSDMIDASVTLLGGNAALVRVRGEIDGFTAQIVQRAIGEAIALGVPRLLIDLDGVTFFGSAGLGLLVQTHRRAILDHVELAVVCSNKLVLRPLELAGLLEQFVVSASAGGALGLPLT